ncbi:MAG: hypothetical protein OJJ54_13650 [Pseudonocardia sp.]|nr:hypothetical protein [Pseudonocardia sp.]
MTEPEPNKTTGIDLKRAAEIAGVVTVFGLLGQTLAFLAARDYYRAFGLQPDQLGVTPLNALLRVSTTTIVAILITLLIFLLCIPVVNWFYPAGSRASFTDPATGVEWVQRLKRVKPGKLIAVERPSAAPQWALLLMALLLTMALGNLLAGLGEGAAGDFKANGSGGPKSWNVVARDLTPARGTAFWPKKEELPVLGNMPPTNVREVAYLGTSNSVTYLYDEASKQTLVVPSGQVQVYVTPPVGS